MNIYLILLVVFAAQVATKSARTAHRMKSGADFTAGMDYASRHKRTMAHLWGTACVVVVLSMIVGISFYDLGFRAIDFEGALRTNVLVIAACVVLLGMMILSKINDNIRKKLAKRHNTGVTAILPHNGRQRWWWVAVSATAGITEEIIFRGFVLYLIFAVLPDISTIGAIAIGGLIFGLGHMYQGIGGIIMTTLTGALFGHIFIATGSLIPGIVLHFMMDVANVFLLNEETTE